MRKEGLDGLTFVPFTAVIFLLWYKTHNIKFTILAIFIYLFFLVYLFLERAEGSEKEKKRNIDVRGKH